MKNLNPQIVVSITEHHSGALVYEAKFKGHLIAGVARNATEMVSQIQDQRLSIIAMGEDPKVGAPPPNGWMLRDGALVRDGLRVVTNGETIGIMNRANAGLYVPVDVMRYVLDHGGK